MLEVGDLLETQWIWKCKAYLKGEQKIQSENTGIIGSLTMQAKYKTIKEVKDKWLEE